MTVASEISKIIYNGNGSTVVFSTSFSFLNNEDVKVVLTSSTGIETTLSITTHYTLSGGGGSVGNVTMITAPASGQKLTIYRQPPLTQVTDYVNGDSFDAESHERALDKLTQIAQNLKENVNRSLKVPVSSLISTELTPQANYVLGWNPTASALINIATTSLDVYVDHVFDTKADAIIANVTNVSWILLLSLNIVGDNGGGYYLPVGSEPNHAGKLQTADGRWWELYTQKPNIHQFGAIVNDNSASTINDTAIANAFDYCSKKAIFTLEAFSGDYTISDTIIVPPAMTFLGQGNADIEDGNGDGTRFRTDASITPSGRRWTDVDGFDSTDYVPMMVLAGNEVRIENMTLENNTGGTAVRYDCGLFVPCVQRSRLINVDIRGPFSDCGIYIDATWSENNTTLTSLHNDIYPAAGMNDFYAQDCRIVAGLWGIKMQGTTRSTATTPWVWSPGGVSDINFHNCRITNFPRTLSEASTTGGCLTIDLRGSGTYIGQGQYFTRCQFRCQGKYLVKYDYARRVQFSDCYAEGLSNWTALYGDCFYTTSANTSHLFHTGDSMFNSSITKDISAFGGTLTVYDYESSDILETNATVDFTSMAANATQQSGAITLTGASVGDIVEIGLPTSFGNNGLLVKGWVSASNQVRIACTNLTGGTIDPASSTFKIRIKKTFKVS